MKTCPCGGFSLFLPSAYLCKPSGAKRENSSTVAVLSKREQMHICQNGVRENFFCVFNIQKPFTLPPRGSWHGEAVTEGEIESLPLSRIFTFCVVGLLV